MNEEGWGKKSTNNKRYCNTYLDFGYAKKVGLSIKIQQLKLKVIKITKPN